MENKEKLLSQQEQKKLDHPAIPSPHLYTKIVHTMKQQGLLSAPRPLLSLSPVGILTALFAVVAMAGLGYWAGSQQSPQSAPPLAASSGKPQFALLVKADDVPPADATQQFQEYSAWVENLKKERWADGEALHGKAWRLHKTDGTVQSVEHTLKTTPDELSGYFLFEAENAEEALKIAQTCPHLNYQGTLELREIYK